MIEGGLRQTGTAATRVRATVILAITPPRAFAYFLTEQNSQHALFGLHRLRFEIGLLLTTAASTNSLIVPEANEFVQRMAKTPEKKFFLYCLRTLTFRTCVASKWLSNDWDLTW